MVFAVTLAVMVFVPAILVAIVIVMASAIGWTSAFMAIYFAAWLFDMAWAARRHAWFVYINVFTANIAWLSNYAIR